MLTPEAIRRIDSRGMYDLVTALPEHWRAARDIVEATSLSIDLSGIQQVIVAGMGGSAIGGDLLRTYALDGAALPIFVIRGYQLPAFAGPHTLVITSSFSGNTEETLAIFDQAKERGVTILSVASGGALKERAETDGMPFVQIPGGMPPRAALGYSFGVLLAIARKLGIVDVSEQDLEETDTVLRSAAVTFGSSGNNHALELATALKDKLPVIYSESSLLEAVNLRWRCQINENSKRLVSSNLFPELNHNEIMGWEEDNDLMQALGVVVLRDRDDHPRVQKRMDVTRDLLSKKAGLWIEVESQGSSRLARMMFTAYLGDWVSLFLGLIREVDPTPIAYIDRLKNAL